MTLASLRELQVAPARNDAQPLRIEVHDGPPPPSIRRSGKATVLAPACEVANVALCLRIFSIAVLAPRSRETTNARGAAIAAASAWSAHPTVMGALQGMGPRHTSIATAEPSLSRSDSGRAIANREARR